jgi:hypothetical protein
MSERFVVTFAALPGADPVRALRALLKAARRMFGLRAVKVEPAGPSQDLKGDDR